MSGMVATSAMEEEVRATTVRNVDNPMDRTSVQTDRNESKNGIDKQEAEESDSGDELPFEPFDIHNDGRIVKTASHCLRASWKRPEAGWDVTLTIHRFCEFIPKSVDSDDTPNAGNEVAGSREVVIKVEPNLQMEVKLAREDDTDDDKEFPQKAFDDANAAAVELHPLLHDGIETMGRNERATFVVTTDYRDGNGILKPRCLEYDISLDDWTEEVDLSKSGKGPLFKRIVRDGDGATQPVDVGRVTIRCRLVRVRHADELPPRSSEDDTTEAAPMYHDKENGSHKLQTTSANAEVKKTQGRAQEEVVYDNMQDQDGGGSDDDANGAGLKGPMEFALDDCPFGPGVFILVESMSRGEVCNAWLRGPYIPDSQPDDEHYQYYVTLELVEVEQLPPVWESDEVRLQFSTRFKLEGNEKFAAGDYDRAIRRYAKAVRYAEGVGGTEGTETEDESLEEDVSKVDTDNHVSSPKILADIQANDDANGEAPLEERNPGTNQKKTKGGSAPLEDTLVDTQVAILCNLTASHLKIGDPMKAREYAEQAVTLRPLSESAAGIKPSYRKACTLEALGDWEGSRALFKRVLEKDSTNVCCRQGLARLASTEKAYRNSLKSVFGGCLVSGKLNGFASDDRPAPKATTTTNDGLGPRDFDNNCDMEGPWSDDGDEESGGYEEGGSDEASTDSTGDTEGSEDNNHNENIVPDGEDVDEEKWSVEKEPLGSSTTEAFKTKDPSKETQKKELTASHYSGDSQPVVTVDSSSRTGENVKAEQCATARSAGAIAPASEPCVVDSCDRNAEDLSNGETCATTIVVDDGFVKVPSPSKQPQEFATACGSAEGVEEKNSKGNNDAVEMPPSPPLDETVVAGQKVS